MAKNRRSRDRRPARRSPFREPRTRFLVVCEGKVTEPQYLTGFKNACQNPLVSLVIADETGVPKSVVDIAKRYKKEAEQEADRENDENLKYDSVWAVFDVDEHPSVPDAIQMARDNRIHLAISNPTFELWLLLHFRDSPGMKGRNIVCKMLKTYVPNYEKHVKYDQFRDGYTDAVKRAMGLGSTNLTTCNPGPNPSTGVHELTEAIRLGAAAT
jgi:hypothetical protein